MKISSKNIQFQSLLNLLTTSYYKDNIVLILNYTYYGIRYVTTTTDIRKGNNISTNNCQLLEEIRKIETKEDNIVWKTTCGVE